MKLTEHQQRALVAQPDPIDWQARAVAAEVALSMITDAQSQEEVVIALGKLPDLAAARELIDKAGECDAYMRLYGEGMLEIAGLKRAFCDAALAFAAAKASIEDKATDYQRALAALRAARMTHAQH
jgi:hypothetical protein